MSQCDYYPCLRPAYRVIKTPDMGVLIKSAERSVLDDGRGNVWVDADAVTVLEYCDGHRSIKEIKQALANTDQEASRIESFLKQMERLGCLDMATDPDAVNPDIRGNTAYYVPMHVSLELTDACNLSCDHCYRISDPTEGAFIDYEDAVGLIDGLAEAGTMGVELTGGEPTISCTRTKRSVASVRTSSSVTGVSCVAVRRSSAISSPRRTVRILPANDSKL